ncbi:hypothetical protein HDV06_000341 [Boothiomyces sp. JEL0866]|nr:hypothetical protein HDV06_000341 [Boothiomyces sp. JEL0866]
MDPLSDEEYNRVLIATTVFNGLSIALCGISVVFLLKSRRSDLNSKLVTMLLIGEIFYQIGQIPSNWLTFPGFWCGVSGWAYIAFSNVTMLCVLAIAVNIIYTLLYKQPIPEKYHFMLVVVPTSFGLLIGSLPLIVDGYGFNAQVGSCYYTEDLFNGYWPWLTRNLWILFSIIAGLVTAIVVALKVSSLGFDYSNDSFSSFAIIRAMCYPAVLLITQVPTIIQLAYQDSAILLVLAYTQPALQGILHALIYLTSPIFKRDLMKVNSHGISDSISEQKIVLIS